MSTEQNFVIVGGGLAGASAAEELRKQGFDGSVTLLASEKHEPYIRPPLSKGYLNGSDGLDAVYVHPSEWYTENHIDVKIYRVIYEIFDDLKKALSGMLTPEEREKLHGHAEIRAVYKFSKVGSIAGCFVTDGHIQRGSKIRLIRDGKIITEDLSIETLKRVKDDVKEVKSGLECGIKLAGYDDIKQGDRLEAYVKETFQRTL